MSEPSGPDEHQVGPLPKVGRISKMWRWFTRRATDSASWLKRRTTDFASWLKRRAIDSPKELKRRATNCKPKELINSRTQVFAGNDPITWSQAWRFALPSRSFAVITAACAFLGFWSVCFGPISFQVYLMAVFSLILIFICEMYFEVIDLISFVNYTFYQPVKEKLEQHRFNLNIGREYWISHIVPLLGTGSPHGARARIHEILLIHIEDKFFELFLQTSRSAAIQLITCFALLWVRLALACCLTTIAIVYTDRILPHAQCDRPVYGATPHRLDSIPGNASLILDAVYLNIVTLGTVGYGDLAPATWAGKVVASFQIVIAVLYLTVGVNVLMLAMVETLPSNANNLSRRLANHLIRVSEDNQWGKQ